MVDCAEGTTRQFLLQPFSHNHSNARVAQVQKIFITHMHADHIMGLVPLLRNVLMPPPTDLPLDAGVNDKPVGRCPPSMHMFQRLVGPN